MNPIDVDIVLLSTKWQEIPGHEKIIRSAIAASVLEISKELKNEQELSIALSDDEHIGNLNKDFRGKNKPTNVLSFPSPSPQHLGDIVMAIETLQREALAEGLALEDHLAHLTVHGLLHLFGYDHEDEAGAEVMEALETRILAHLSIADPHAGGRMMPDEERDA